MRLNLTADSIKVDDDDGRICLIIDTDEGDTVTVNIHAVALDFYANVQTQLRPYALEAEHARAEWTPGIPRLVTNRPVSVEDAIATGYALLDNALDSGYELDDPKSPGYHDRVVD